MSREWTFPLVGGNFLTASRVAMAVWTPTWGAAICMALCVLPAQEVPIFVEDSFVCSFIHSFIHPSIHAFESAQLPERVRAILLELESHVLLSFLRWVPGTEPRLPARAAGVFNPEPPLQHV